MARDVYDIFLSYAWFDNTRETGRADEEGWVDFFQRRLIAKLQLLGRPDVQFWRDVAEVEGKDRFSPNILDGLAKCHLFLPIVSVNYVQRPWCKREIDTFANRAQNEAGIDGHILPVFKNEVAEDNLPPILRGRIGYPFWRKDVLTNGCEELFKRGNYVDEDAYLNALEKLAKSVVGCLPASTSVSDEEGLSQNGGQRGDGLNVFIAPPADDVFVAYEKLKNELNAAGIGVLPDRDKVLAENCKNAEILANDALASAAFAIHLLGRETGPRMPGGRLVDKMLEFSKATKPKRLIWAPSELFLNPLHPESAVIESGRDPVTVLCEFGDFRRDDGLSGAPLSAFCDEALRRCREKQTPPSSTNSGNGATPRVYVMADRPDLKLASQAARTLFEAYGIEAESCTYDGSEDEIRKHHHNLMQNCDAVLYCWGKTSEAWLKIYGRETKNLDVIGRAEPFRVRAVLPINPINATKEDFFSPHIPLNLPPADDITPLALQPFVDALRAGV